MLEKILAAHCHFRPEGTLSHDLRVFPSVYEVGALPHVTQESRWIEDWLWVGVDALQEEEGPQKAVQVTVSGHTES